MTSELIIDIIIALLLAVVGALQAYTTRTISEVRHNTNSLTQQLMAFSRKAGADDAREERRVIDAGAEEKP